MNNRITAKERNLLKGAIRRVFSRSELRRKIIDTAIVEHYDKDRKRVTKWCKCPVCKEFTPKYLMAVDHIMPVIGIKEHFKDVSLDVFVDKLWCEENNLQPICAECHKQKSKAERKERTKFNREEKKAA